MHKNNIRYNKGGLLLDIQNQKYHYKHIIHPRRSVHAVEDRSDIYSAHKNKYEKDLIKTRQMENQRLYHILTSIQKGKGIIEQMSERANQQQKTKKRSTLYNAFKVKQKKKQMYNQNKRMVQKIYQARSIIGNSLEWDQHYQRSERQKKKISKATQNVFDAQSLFTQTNADLKTSNLRQTIDFYFTKQKFNSRKNKTVQKTRISKDCQINQQGKEKTEECNNSNNLITNKKQHKKFLPKQILLSRQSSYAERQKIKETI